MFAPLKRVAAITMAVGSVVIVGCDDLKSGDKNIQENLKKANQELIKADFSSLDPVQNDEAATQVLASFKTAADDNSASPIWKATASDAAGRLQLQIAEAKMNVLRSTEQEIRQTLADLRSLGQQVSLNTYIINGYKAQDAKQTVADIDAVVKRMQGDAQNLTWGIKAGQESKLQTLSAVNQKVSNLEGQIAERKSRIAALQGDRNAAIGDAEAKLTQAAKLKGNESLQVYTEGVQARQKTEEISMKVELEQVQLQRLESDLALAKNEIENINKGIATLQQQANIITESDAELKTRITKQQEISKLIALGEKDEQFTIASKSKVLEKLLEDAKAKRNSLSDSLTEAAKYFEAAAQAGSTAGTELRNPGKGDNESAMKHLAKSVNAGKYNLSLGVTQRQLATVSANHAQLLSEIASTRLVLSNAINGAEVTLTLWPATETKDIEDLIKASDESLKSSLEKLENATSGDADDGVKNAASVAKLITMYRQIELANLQKAINIQAKSNDDIAKLVSDAQALKTEMLDKHLVLPKVPGELGEMPAVVPPTTTVETPTNDTAVDTPEIVAVKKTIDDVITQATTTGQFQPVIDMLIIPDYLRDPAQPILDIVPTIEKVHQSVVAKFGEDGWKSLMAGDTADANAQDPTKMLASFREQLAKAKFKNINETEVELIPEAPAPEGKKIVFKKVDDLWKLDVGGIISEQEAPMISIAGAFVGGIKTKLDQLATDIDSGKYSTIDEVKAAWKALGQEMTPGGGATPPTGDAAPANPTN